MIILINLPEPRSQVVIDNIFSILKPGPSKLLTLLDDVFPFEVGQSDIETCGFWGQRLAGLHLFQAKEYMTYVINCSLHVMSCTYQHFKVNVYIHTLIRYMYIYIYRYMMNTYWMLYVKIVFWKNRGSFLFSVCTRAAALLIFAEVRYWIYFLNKILYPKLGYHLQKIRELSCLNFFFEKSTR